MHEQPILAIARHGETLLNSQGRWSGRLETPLTFNGYVQAMNIARLVSNMEIDVAFTSTSERTKLTWSIIQAALGLSQVTMLHSEGLLERDIGQFAGLHYEEIKQRFHLTTEEIEAIRLGYTSKPPEGETREQVYMRVSEVYEEQILPHLSVGRNVFVVGHNISTSALMMRVEKRPHTETAILEIERAKALCYTIDAQSKEPIDKVLLG